uniref:Oxidative stress 3 n=1 Tax=Davidia involucrata TaxID=16924 RepID=A0A5B6YPY2_DAVIN
MLSMGEGKQQIPQGLCSQKKDQWAIMEGDDDNDTYNITSSTPSSSSFSSLELEEDSTISNESSDMADDDTSSSTSSYSSSSQSTAPLYDLSELMAQLPIKRGLSKFYQGKSESFTSLSRVRSIEDLAKKESPYKRKMKACKSHGGGLDTYKLFTLPKPTISKKTSRVHSILVKKLVRFENLDKFSKKNLRGN